MFKFIRIRSIHNNQQTGRYLNEFQRSRNCVRIYLQNFSNLNDKVSRKISLTPNIPEETLDISFIEFLSDSSAPTVISPGWAVRISAHFIGNIRQYRRYEIADIGVVVVFKRKSNVIGRKLVLLQSKRLYPNNGNYILDNTNYA